MNSLSTNGTGRSNSARTSSDRRKSLMSAAMDIAISGAFSAVTVREIARHADVGLGTMYRHFSSKDELLFTAAARELSVFLDRLSSSLRRSDSPAVKLGFVAESLSTVIHGNRQLAEATTRAGLTGSADGTAMIRVRASLSNLLRSCVSGDECSDGPSQADVDVLTDIWLPNLIGLIFGRVEVHEVMDRLNRSAALFLERWAHGSIR